VARAASLACVLEVSAEKVGNVTPSKSFADAGYGDFVANAVVLGPAIARAVPSRVGWAVYQAIAATRRLTPANTHLGVALLLAPLAAAWRGGGAGTLRRRLAAVLRGLSVEDARWAYRAIRLANPGGLGSGGPADVRRSPRITLREAMALAASRDAIAAEYVRDFTLTFSVALPALRRAMRHGLSILQSIVQAHLEIMAHTPDTLIARKAGKAVAAAVAARARAVIRAGGLRTSRGRAAVHRLDRALRKDGNRLNPGTSADLVAAALFAWLLEADGARLG
jgi:triphosphoribosyl-dephospho-CoA synthase